MSFNDGGNGFDNANDDGTDFGNGNGFDNVLFFLLSKWV